MCMQVRMRHTTCIPLPPKLRCHFGSTQPHADSAALCCMYEVLLAFLRMMQVGGGVSQLVFIKHPWHQF